MESRNFKNMTMQYLTMRWFTISHFDKEKLRFFHSLERALKTASTKDINLYWHIQTEYFLKKEFKKITSNMNNKHLTKLKNFDSNLYSFLKENKIDINLFFKNLDFLQKCDEIIYHTIHANNTASYILTSLP